MRYFERAYHAEFRGLAQRWLARAKRGEGNQRYAKARARTLALDPWQRAEACEKRHVTVKCGCRYVRLPVGCGQRWLCPRCQRRFYRRYRSRLKRAMKAAHRAAMSAWRQNGCTKGQRRDWTLVTLTVRHSGDLAVDRSRLVKAWARFRQWLHHAIGQFPFALTWECTPGRDCKGHLHAHVACLWPRWDWKLAQPAWVRATGGESTRINLERAVKGAGGAAAYLAKYVSKGLNILEAPPKLAAELLRVMYGKRVVSSSHRFWRPVRKTCRTCCQPFELAELPRPLKELRPGYVAAAWSRLNGVVYQRGPPTWTNPVVA